MREAHEPEPKCFTGCGSFSKQDFTDEQSMTCSENKAGTCSSMLYIVYVFMSTSHISFAFSFTGKQESLAGTPETADITLLIPFLIHAAQHFLQK